MSRIVAVWAWAVGALVSGSLLLGVLVMASRTDRVVWLAFALAAGAALIMKLWPRMDATARWLVAALYALFYLTYQVGPWMHVGDRVGVNRNVRQLAELYDRHFYAAQGAAMALAAGLLLVQAVRGRKRPWFSVWFLVSLACGLLVLFYSGPEGAPNDFAQRLAAFLGVSLQTAETLVVLGRKAVHFMFYGVFAAAAVRAAEAAGAGRRVALWSGVGFALLHALFDEARQSSFPNRTGSAWDVLLDAAGMACFVWLAGAPRGRGKRRP